MNARAPKLLVDALGAAQAAQEFLGGLTLAEYVLDRKTRSAVERQLEILGEACNQLVKLDPSIASRVAAVRLAIGVRNRVIHGYDSVDHSVVHEIVVDDLPGLVTELSALLAALGTP